MQLKPPQKNHHRNAIWTCYSIRLITLKMERTITDSFRHSQYLPFSPTTPSTPLAQRHASFPVPTSATAGSLSGSTSTLRYPQSRKTIYDRHLNRSRGAELSKASFAFLFGEMVQYAQRRVSGIQDLEKKWVIDIRFFYPIRRC